MGIVEGWNAFYVSMARESFKMAQELSGIEICMFPG